MSSLQVCLHTFVFRYVQLGQKANERTRVICHHLDRTDGISKNGSWHFFLRKVCGPKKGLTEVVIFVCLGMGLPKSLGPLPANAAGQLYVLGHDGDSLGVNSTQVGILKETHQVGFRGLLQCHYSTGLES